MTLLRDLITIPESVSEGDFVVRASETADLANYVVTDQLRECFQQALGAIGHAVTSKRSQAKFLHGSFGSGKSHFMAVLREILKHNPQARGKEGLVDVVAEADPWLRGCTSLTLTFHMLEAKSVEQAVLEGYLTQITALHPDAPVPAVHQSDEILVGAAGLREDLGDEKFFARLNGVGGGVGGASGGSSLAAIHARHVGWTPATYAAAASAKPGTEERDRLISALTSTFYRHAIHSGEWLDLDTGLQVITRHAKDLGYDVVVFFLDELILWLSTKISDHAFVNTEGAKLNKLVESSDANRPLPLVSFVARQRNLEEFLGPQIGGTEREALAHVMRSVQGRLGEIILQDTNLPEITEKRLLRPRDAAAKQVIDDAFAAVRGKRDVWDVLLLGAQYGDAGVGSDAAAFRRVYPFSPALVATLVALSQALQRERTALHVMTELLVNRRDTLKVNDLIGVATLFDPLVMRGELPDRPELRAQFQAARDTYRGRLRPALLARNGITEEQAAGHTQFKLDDNLVKTLLIGALVPEVPALRNLNAARLHALNFGSITAPVPGYESQVIVDRLGKLAADRGEVNRTAGPDPVFAIKLSSVDYDRLLDYVPNNETATGVRQQLIRDLVAGALGMGSTDGTFGELEHYREWRGRKHQVTVRFGNIRDQDSMPDSALYATGDSWRVVIDYPFDDANHGRNDDKARIERLDRGSCTVLWLPLFITDELQSRVMQLVKINYLLGAGGLGDRLNTLAVDWSPADRQAGKVYLQGRQQELRSAILDALKQAYGAAKAQPAEVISDPVPILHTLADGLHLGELKGGTLQAAFDDLTAQLLRWSYPGKPALPEDEKAVTSAEMGKVLRYATLAAADPTRGVAVDSADRRTLQRVCNLLRLGELAEHRYVLTSSTCWWSGHLTQEAAKLGYQDRFPVHVMRRLLDEPEPRGFDRQFQNLIISVVALEQRLAWYQHGVKVELHSLQGINDQMELRHPPMPEPEVWDRAVSRGNSMFGIKFSEYLSPASVAMFGSAVREHARMYQVPTARLVNALSNNAEALGLDPSAAQGRLATANYASRLLLDIVHNDDDVAVVRLVAGSGGDIDAGIVGASIKQAQDIAYEISRNANLLIRLSKLALTNDSVKNALQTLRSIAHDDQHRTDLIPALGAAIEAALESQLDDIVIDDGRGKDDEVVDDHENVKDVVDHRPGRQPRTVRNHEDVEQLAADIEKDLAGGKTVRVTWQILP